MTAYMLGNIVGRLAFAYLLVWLIAFCIKKFNYRQSVAALHSVPGLSFVLAVFLIPLLASVGEYL